MTDLEGESSSEPLYFDANGSGITDSRFAVGTTTRRESNDYGRATIHFDRGPCKS
jgi:hypothetical protein